MEPSLAHLVTQLAQPAPYCPPVAPTVILTQTEFLDMMSMETKFVAAFLAIVLILMEIAFNPTVLLILTALPASQFSPPLLA